MRSYKKGQQTTEIIVITAIIVGIALTGLYYFGGSLKDIFEGNPIFSTFASKNRTAVNSNGKDDKYSFTVNGVTITSSVAKAITEDASTIATTGASGQVTQTAKVILDTVIKLLNLMKASGIDISYGTQAGLFVKGKVDLAMEALATLSADNTVSNADFKVIKDKFMDSIGTNVDLIKMVSEKAVDQEKAGSIEAYFDNLTAKNNICQNGNCTAEQAIKEMEFGIDNKKGGQIATDFEKQKNDMLASLPPEVGSDVKSLIATFSDDLLNLSSSIYYEISPSMLNKIKDSYKSTFDEARRASDQIIEALFPCSLTSPLGCSANWAAKFDRDQKLNLNGFTDFQAFMTKMVLDHQAVVPLIINNLSHVISSQSTGGHVDVTETAFNDVRFYEEKNCAAGVSCRGPWIPKISINGTLVYNAAAGAGVSPFYMDKQYANGVEYIIFHDPGDINVIYAIQKDVWTQNGRSSNYNFNSYRRNLIKLVLPPIPAGQTPPPFVLDSFLNLPSTPNFAVTKDLEFIQKLNIDLPNAINTMKEQGIIDDDFIKSTITVGREGNFNEILGDSYDAKVLCKTLYGETSSKCE